MQLRYVAAVLAVGQGLIWLAIQPGIPAMGDITGEDDGSLIQGLAILIPATILAWGFAVSVKPWLFLAWNAVWVALWTLYSIHHLQRWAVEAPGTVWLLVPELFVVLHALALAIGVAAILAPRSRASSTSRSPSS